MIPEMAVENEWFIAVITSQGQSLEISGMETNGHTVRRSHSADIAVLGDFSPINEFPFPSSMTFLLFLFLFLLLSLPLFPCFDIGRHCDFVITLNLGEPLLFRD